MDCLQGQFLVASPQLCDPHFAQTVVLIVQHDEDGTLGVVLNRPGSMTLAEGWTQVSAAPCERDAILHEGGPCEGPLIALHTHAEQSQIDIMPGVCFSTRADAVAWLVTSGDMPLKFIVGFSGWSPGQLESELAEKAWQVVPAVKEWIFNTPADLWGMLMRRQSRPRYQGMKDSIVPPDPSWN